MKFYVYINVVFSAFKIGEERHVTMDGGKFRSIDNFKYTDCARLSKLIKGYRICEKTVFYDT